MAVSELFKVLLQGGRGLDLGASFLCSKEMSSTAHQQAVPDISEIVISFVYVENTVERDSTDLLRDKDLSTCRNDYLIF